MRAEVAGARGTGPLDVDVAQAGFGRQQTARSEGLQRLITAQREQVRRDDLHRQVMLLHHSDTRRQAWLACDCFSTAFVSSYPSERDALSAREFPEVITQYMGRESPAVRSLAGRNIPCTPPRVSDAFGHQLGLATLTDRAHADCHDELRDAISNDLFRSGLRGQREPKGIFSAVLPARYLATRDQLTGRGVPAIVPDARVHVRLAAPYTSRADVRQHGPRGPMLPGADRLMDFKTIHAGCQSYQSARSRDGERMAR